MLVRYIVRRTLAGVLVVLGVTLITFVLISSTAGSFVPGLKLNPGLRPEDIERIRHNLGLDLPWYLRYFNWLWQLLHGDLGRSLIDGSPVSSHILERLPNTLELAGTAILIGLLLAIPLGFAGALRRGSPIDSFVTALAVTGVSVPSFWLGLMLILLFSVQFEAWGLPWLPSGGATSPVGGGDPIDRALHLLLPATVLAFGYLAVWSRFTRSSVIEVLSQDYIRTARAKGMSESRVVWVHALRNAALPLITLVALELPSLVGGAAIVEIVFSWPGIGRLALEHSLEFDYTTVMGITTFVAIMVVVGNLLADLVYAVADPRVRLG
jgi:peptide/nickel transport system permease protein